MSPFKNLFQRLQDSMDELSDALSGTSTAERLLDTDIRQLDDNLHNWRQQAAALKAQRISTSEHIRDHAARIRALEADALDALRARRTSAARELAERIAGVQTEKADAKLRLTDLQTHEKQLLHVIDQGESKLRRLKHQLDTLRASESLQRAQATVAKRQSDTAAHPETAMASAKRVRQKRAGNPGTARRDASKSRPPADAILDRLAARLATSQNDSEPSARTATRRRK